MSDESLWMTVEGPTDEAVVKELTDEVGVEGPRPVEALSGVVACFAAKSA
jgi:hypothetical protein